MDAGLRPGDRRRPGAQRRVRALRVHHAASSGQFFRQFALTIAVSTLISAFNSLTLSPALAALLLRPRQKRRPHEAAAAAGVPAARRLAGLRVPGALARGRWPAAAARAGRSLADVRRLGAVGGRRARRRWSAGCSSRPLNRVLGWFFRRFNRGLRPRRPASTRRVVGGLLRVSVLVLVVYGGLLVLT